MPKFFQKSLKNISRIIFTGMFIMVGTFSFATPANAMAWGMLDIFGDLMTNMVEQIEEQIKGALLGALKGAAIQALNSKVGQLVGGSSAGGALFITDFNDFLYQGPAQRTELYMNDFFTLTTRGKTSGSNYIGAGDSGGIGGNYTSYLVDVGKQATTGAGGVSAYNLEEYTPNPEAMFAEGDFRAFNAFFSNPANNPYGYSLQAEQVYQDTLAREQQAAMVEAQSSGFIGNKKGGKVVTPAGAIEAVVADVSTLGNKVIASAENPGQLLSGVISGMANKMISNLIQRGVGQVQSNIQREIGNVSSQVRTTSNQSTQQFGPGAQFDNSITQRLNVNVNSSTPPPAAGQ